MVAGNVPAGLRVCQGCGIKFKRKRGRNAGKYHSRECAFTHYRAWLANQLEPAERLRREQERAQRNRAPLAEKQCAKCGTRFVALRQRRFCDECKKLPAYERHLYQPQAGVVVCQECGRSVRFETHIGKRVYCSKRCGKRWHKRLRRARKKGAFIEPVSFAYIYQRDRGRCQLCGKLVLVKQVAPHPRSPTLDHIIPFAKQGTHEEANVQLACFGCNSRWGTKGDKQQRLFG